MACLGFTYGCFAGLPMAWPFGTIVGSNCGCDRHPVSSLNPLSILVVASGGQVNGSGLASEVSGRTDLVLSCFNLQTILPHDRCHVA